MSSRGSIIKYGFVTTNDYSTLFVTSTGAKVLVGIGNNHSLPELSHSPNSIYVKLKNDNKTLHEVRFFDENCNPIIEIGYHPEPNLNNKNRENNILHFHTYKGLVRDKTVIMNDEIFNKYKFVLKEFNIYGSK